MSSGFSSWTQTEVKRPGSAGGDLTTSWLHYSPPWNPTVTFFSPVWCSNKHPEITLFLPLSMSILQFLSSFCLFSLPLNSVGRHALTWFEPCLDPTEANPTTHEHTKGKPTWFRFATWIRVCVDFVFTGMWLCCNIFMISFNEGGLLLMLFRILSKEQETKESKTSFSWSGKGSMIWQHILRSVVTPQLGLNLRAAPCCA